MIRFIAIVLMLILPMKLAAESDKSEYLISFFETPITDRLKLVLRNAYADIGIPVRFIEMPPGRRLIELDKGYIDADMGGSAISINQYENIISVDVPLLSASIMLICPPDVTCDRSVFDNSRTDVYSMSGHVNILLSSNFIRPDSLPKIRDGMGTDKLHELFENKRLDFFTQSHIDGYDNAFINREHQTHLLVENITIRHYTHVKHQAIHPLLKTAIENQLQLNAF